MTDVALPQDTAVRRPVALGPTAGEPYWFFGTLLTIKAGSEETAGGAVITENLAPRGAGSPLHVHHREDEWFYVLEGELTFWVGGEIIVAGPADSCTAPATSRIRSPSAPSRLASCS